MTGWLCQCGNGNLLEDYPEVCPLCGFPLGKYFDFDSDYQEPDGPDNS